MSNDNENGIAGKNIADYDVAILVKGYRTATWTPEKDGHGTPTQVHLVMELDGIDGIVAMRFKSPRAIDSLIGDLLSYRDQVWPFGFHAKGQDDDDDDRS